MAVTSFSPFSFPSPLSLLCSLLFLFLLPLVSSIAPPNPFLADSLWPIAQHDNYAQASTLAEGPLQPGAVDYLFSDEIMGALTVLYTEDKKVVWGSSLSSVFKVDRSGPQMRLVASIEKDTKNTKTDTFRGIYSVLTKEGRFYISSSNIISVYEDLEKGNSLSGIRHVGDYDFGPKARPKERVLALSFTYDGQLVFCTNEGGIGILSTDEPPVLYGLAYATADQGLSPPVSVTNSVSVDEHGGIYLVTSRFMHRMWWDATNKQLHSLPPPFNREEEGGEVNQVEGVGGEEGEATKDEEHGAVLGGIRQRLNGAASRLPFPLEGNVRGAVLDGVRSRGPEGEDSEMLAMGMGSYGHACPNVAASYCQVWSTSYPVDAKPIEGRPTKEGSGTTPSLLLDGNTGRLYVVIADGRRKQEVLAIDAVTGEIAATAPVQFHDDPTRESYTEQSILVNGNRLLVAQNALTPPGQRINDFLEAINAKEIVSGMDVPEFVQENVYLLPVFLGDSPRGFQQFELDTTGARPELRVTWTRGDVGCPNSIPTMSETIGVMYCVGRTKSAISEVLNQGMSAGWTVEAFQWENGTSIFSAPVGNTLLFNSLYAATQIGPSQEIIYGSVGGLVRLHDGAGAREGGNLGSLFDGINSMLSSSVQQGSMLLSAAAGQAVDAFRLIGGEEEEPGALGVGRIRGRRPGRLLLPSP